jgi:hypothetical protein
MILTPVYALNTYSVSPQYLQYLETTPRFPAISRENLHQSRTVEYSFLPNNPKSNTPVAIDRLVSHYASRDVQRPQIINCLGISNQSNVMQSSRSLCNEHAETPRTTKMMALRRRP